MEFEHVGLHCSDCKRKDFLPVQCPRCSKHFCKLCVHESFHTNGCQRADMTSFDCPVCGKSVKHDKAVDVNEVWSIHFASDCSQQQPQTRTSDNINTKTVGKKEKETVSAADLCFFAQCGKHLGPSNRFRCTKCHKEVCLSHRMPEAHDCLSLQRLRRQTAPSVAKPKISAAGIRSSATRTEVELCPMCQARFSTATELVSHFERSHAEPPSSGQQPAQSASQSTSIFNVFGKMFSSS